MRKTMGEFQTVFHEDIFHEENVTFVDSKSEIHPRFNRFILGEMGSASKTKIFKEKEFKTELAPSNAKIECFEMNGEKLVRMMYEL